VTGKDQKRSSRAGSSPTPGLGVILWVLLASGCVIHDKLDFTYNDTTPPQIIEAEVTPPPGEPIALDCPQDGGVPALELRLACVIDESVNTTDGLLAARLYVDYDPSTSSGARHDGTCVSKKGTSGLRCWEVMCLLGMDDLLGAEDHALRVVVSDMDFVADAPQPGAGTDLVWWSVDIGTTCGNSSQ